jgi:RNA polymerase sigma-54 factor
MKSILDYQREFFEKGVAYLKPMILRDVSLDIGMHESTVSRVTTNKYAYTPQGLFELKFFFNSSINRFQGEAVASASVQEKIRQIIETEHPAKPYSDSKIVEMLKVSNINIARRTVAKYRDMMNILPSSKRKRI